MGGMPKFSSSTDGTSVKLSSDGHLRNTVNEAMEVRDTARMKMAELLMPEKTELIAGEMMESVLYTIGHVFIRGSCRSRGIR